MIYSKNEIKRLCSQGGVKLYIPIESGYEIVKLTYEDLINDPIKLISKLGYTDGDYFILRIGKKDWRKIILNGENNE